MKVAHNERNADRTSGRGRQSLTPQATKAVTLGGEIKRIPVG
jgi:hypothetical protein